MLPPIPTLPPATPVPGWWVADMLKLDIVVMVLKTDSSETCERTVEKLSNFMWRFVLHWNYKYNSQVRLRYFEM